MTPAIASTPSRPWRLTLASAALAALLGPLAAPAAQAADTAAQAAPAQACPALLQHRFERLQDEKPQDLCQYAGKVLLVVNTASYCGFTPQYKGLEALHERYRDRGLVVLGFPSNDFGQERDGNGQIADFCENTYGVKFPMFVKSAVRGDDVNPFYRQLAEKSGRQPLWNFHKYLVDRSGTAVSSYTSLTKPEDPDLIADIEKYLLVIK